MKTCRVPDCNEKLFCRELCRNCNLEIGNFQDSINLLTKAIKYLKMINN